MSAATTTAAPAGAAGTAAGRTSTHPYTCFTCQVGYRNAELQRGHMKSDWHRYNSKRRLAQMPPLTAEAFAQRALRARAEEAAQADKSLYEKTCDVCVKVFRSENSYQNHLLSRKHKLNEAQGPPQPKVSADDASSLVGSTFSLGEPISKKPSDDDDDDDDDHKVDLDAEEEFTQVVEGLQKTTISGNRPSPVKRPSNPTATIAAGQTTPSSSEKSRGSSAATPVPPEGDNSVLRQCLFCRYTSPTVRLNAHHMERFHSMYIPEPDYLIDLDGLLMHLHKRVYEDNECLTCRKVKANPFAVQTHMRDVGHCTIPYTSLEEQLDIGDFYDFRSTYSDDEDDEEDEEMVDAEPKGGALLGAKRETTTTGEDGEEVDEEGWETDSSVSSFDSEELTAVLADRKSQIDRLDKSHHHSHTDPRAHRMPDGYHSRAHKHGAHAVYYDEFELHLPTGKSVGHRQHARYFRQNLHNYPSAEERAERLAIEAAGSNGDAAHQDMSTSRQLVLQRGQGGLTGISDMQKAKLSKAVLRGRTAEQNYRKQARAEKLSGLWKSNQYDRGG